MYQFVERHAHSFTIKQSCFSNLLKVISSGLHFALDRQLVAWRFSRGRDFTWLSFATEEYGKSILRRKKSTGRSLVFREARAAYRVHALRARSTYLLEARITVNNGRCTFLSGSTRQIGDCARRSADLSLVLSIFINTRQWEK